MRFFSSIRIVRVSLALAVALWMAGAGCLLGCENMMAAAASGEMELPADSPAIVVDGEVCASMRSHDCCAKGGARSAAKLSVKRHAVADSPKKFPVQAKVLLSVVEQLPAATASFLIPELSGTHPTMVDCPLAVNASAALSKAGSDDSNVALPSSCDTTSLSNSPVQMNRFGSPLRLPNRGHTYLHCCSFLI